MIKAVRNPGLISLTEGGFVNCGSVSSAATRGVYQRYDVCCSLRKSWDHIKLKINFYINIKGSSLVDFAFRM